MNRREWLMAAATSPLAAAGTDVPVHGRFEARLEAGSDADPLGTTAIARVRTPSGARETVPLFWDGGRQWRLRYLAETAGGYEFAVESADRQLNGRKGRFTVAGASGTTVLDREGAPRVSANRRYFTHVSGKPWFWLADTAWNGALLATEQEWDSYLDTRVAQGFTAIQFVMTQWRAGLADENGRKAFRLQDGRLSVDPAFFARLDHRVAAIRQKGLVPVPVMLWALSSKGDESPGIILDVKQAIQLAGYLNARYAAYGALWMLGGDGNYRGEKAERWKEIGRGVFSGLSHRPVTLHPGGNQDPWAGLKDEPWLDFLTCQTGHGQDARKWKWHLEEMPKAASLLPPRPYIDAEPNYEGHLSYRTKSLITDYDVRRASYTSLLLAPAAGISYGAHGVWPWLRKREEPLNHKGSGEGDPVSVCLKYPGAAQLKVLRSIFDRLDWWTLQPAPGMVRENEIDAEFSNAMAAARTADGKQALVYLPKGGSLKLDLSGWSGPVQGAWIDPRTGAETAAGPVQAAMAAPAAGDWVLHIKS